MIKVKQCVSAILLFINTIVLTGCWDRKELNDRALLLGWGVDLAEDGSYIGSAQIIIPERTIQGSAGGKEQGFFVLAGKGKNLTDATASSIQNKLSRQVFAGQRRDIFIGERLAKNGLSKVLDEYTRNPDVRLRTDMFVVKGNTAEALLRVPYPFEKVPAIAAFKIHESAGGNVNTSLAEFLMEINSEGRSPVLPAIEIVPIDEHKKKNEQPIRFYGNAIFNKQLKLIGYLDLTERGNRDWITGSLKRSSFTEFVPESDGYVSADLFNFKGKLEPQLIDNKVKMTIRLSAIGNVIENEGNLDLKESKNLKVIGNAFNKAKEKEILGLIQMVQKQYGADIFGFSDAIHQKFPYRWKELKKNWDQVFPQVDVTVNVNIKIKRAGLDGKPTHLKEGG